MQDSRRLDKWHRHGPSSTKNVSFHPEVWRVRKCIICCISYIFIKTLFLSMLFYIVGGKRICQFVL